MKRLLCLGTIVLVFLVAPSLQAQCMLANPSFELPGSGGANFGGWNQFGAVGTAVPGTHGADAARVSGPNTGSWDVSGYWQSLDAAPGQQWKASVCAWHTGTNPVQGQSTAILNIEWRDGGGNLISYESHTVLDAAAPTNDVQVFTVTSGPAPANTATVRLLLGVLQSPSDPVPDVYYDQAEFEKIGPNGPAANQWNDFPGGRVIGFSGYTWRVKGPGYYGPGPNLFCDTADCTWMDEDGRLHMTVKNISGNWYSTEVVLEDVLGYGDYIFTTRGRLDQLHHNVVLGLFLWEYGACYDPAYFWWNPYNEIDIEFSRWGDPGNGIGQFVAQPYDYPGNLVRFDAAFAEDEITSHAMRWLPDRIEYRSWRGGPNDESPGNMIFSWTYTGPHIARPESPRVHINLWKLSGNPTGDQEVVLDAFTFVGECTGHDCDPTVSVPTGEAGGVTLHAPRPNPFRGQTHLAFTLEEAGPVELTVFDVQGRRVRTLEHGHRGAGRHETAWDGRNGGGDRVAAGLYHYQLKTPHAVVTRRVLILP